MRNPNKNLVRLCRAEYVAEGTPIAIEIDGFPPLVAYNVDGEYFVTDNHCTHGNGLLSDGFQEGGTIECPFHGGSFDIRTGDAKVFPCQVPVRTHSVEVEDGWIVIPALDDNEGR